MARTQPIEPSGNFLLDIAPLLFTIVIMMVQFFGFDDFTPHIPLVCGLVITGLFVRFRKKKWIGMENHFYKVIRVGLPAIILFITIGMLIAAWIISGAVATVLYYGFAVFTPATFLVASCILCSILSLATGTSWGTVGTVGLALMGIGHGLGIPDAWTAGAIISGAFFGDKMSPLSETTNLTPAVVGVDLWDHIKGMIPTTLPAMTVSLLVYAYVGISYQDQVADFADIQLMRETLAANYTISLFTLLPGLVVIISALMRMPALPTVLGGIIVACLMAIIFQGTGVKELFNVLQNGVISQTGVEIVDKLLSKGGVMSMTWVVILTLLALSFVGALEYYGTLNAILQKINSFVRTRFGLVGASYASTISIGTIIGDVYTSLVLPGRLLKDKYTQMGYKRTTLTRSIEDCGTLLSPLIPWNMGGGFVAATLGVATILYAPYAIACWLSPIFGIIWLILDKFIPREESTNIATTAEEDSIAAL
ncbi:MULTISPECIES: Na+/H+ antiporter NhaC [Moraxella]|uniref:Na+/H+ antiporter NhaC n=1 Tax=Moraxella catarrhalis TaxID=480 RepID=A0A7Z0UWB9_MORCA|nr:Na+/H+ antiporter NhaC [Moraxella catarrhalis]OAU98922.1 Na+/H+ antiporter NhaC [Moraxella catarrhalis]STY82472.1 Malate-2H(+)/Na(+)-lactate antiporter [Moraxella catarrhalis]